MISYNDYKFIYGILWAFLGFLLRIASSVALNRNLNPLIWYLESSCCGNVSYRLQSCCQFSLLSLFSRSLRIHNFSILNATYIYGWLQQYLAIVKIMIFRQHLSWSYLNIIDDFSKRWYCDSFNDLCWLN